MDVKAYLLELGYSEEDATTYANDPKLSKVVTASAARYEEGNNAKTAAEEARAEAARKSKELNEWCGHPPHSQQFWRQTTVGP